MRLMFVFAILTVLLVFVYSLMRVAHDADEQADIIFRERLKNGKSYKDQ